MPDNQAAAARWADLAPRVLSGVVLAVVGIADVWIGGIVFDLLVAVVVGLIGWEIARMCVPGRDRLWIPLGVFAGAALIASVVLPDPVAVLTLLGAVLVIVLIAGGDRLRLGLYLVWILVAGWGFVQLREAGLVQVLWLIAVVVATDVAGYFVGRVVGGPKFWPRVSPKKTWSGTAGGWIAAAIVGALFAPALGGPAIWLSGLSVLLSFASQMGDAAESALKRAKGVKDASQLIPGHGGVFDRFDAMMGAALVVTLAGLAGLGGWP